MTPQERDLIMSLFGRMREAGNAPKDAEADDLIRRGLAAQPDAPYLLVQTVLIEDMALSEAHNRIKALEQELASAKSAPPPQPTSFLGARGSVPSAGPWGHAAPPPPAPGGPVWTQSGALPAGAPQPAMAAQPATAPMAPLAMPGASSGFLRQAATTAAGIAGGALLFQGISSLFGPHYGGGFMAGMPQQPGIGETVVNNYYDTPAPQAPDTQAADSLGTNDSGAYDPGIVQADDTQDVGGQDDSSQDFGSDQDFGQDTGGGDGGSFDV